MRTGVVDNPALESRLRRPDSTVRQIVEAHVVEYNTNGTPREHIRGTKAGRAGTRWDEADSLAGFTVRENGDLTLTDTIRTIVSHTVQTALLTDLDLVSPFFAVMIELATTEPRDVPLNRLKFWLAPRRSASQKREVTRWRLRLYGIEDLVTWRDNTAIRPAYVTLLELADPLDVLVAGDTAGEVVFDYGATPPHPWSIHTTYIPVDPPTEPGALDWLRPCALAVVSALNASGGPAANVGLGYNPAVAEAVSAGGSKLRTRRLQTPQWPPDINFRVNAGGRYVFDRLRDYGSAGGAPYCIVESGTYVAQTVTFSVNPFNVGALPTGDLELVGHTQTPPGTSITLRVRNDADTAWVPFTDGQLHSNVGIGKTQPRKMQATLTPDPAGARAPTLKQLGLRAVTRVDLSGICEVRDYEEAFDPQKGQTEIPEGRLVALKDGPRDFHSAIEDLLATHAPKHIVLRGYIGDPALPRDQWLHKTDFLPGGWDGHGSHVELKGLSPLVKLKDLVPPYSPGTSYAPDGDVSAGAWTRDTGSAVNLYQAIDEATVDELDFIQSGLNPVNQVVTFTLPTPTDLAGRRLFVDCEYGKDASGGQTIDLTIRLLQGATIVAELPKTDIGPDRVGSTMELTDPQIAQLTDLPNLRLEFMANASGGVGNRRARVYWARFRSGGRREVVTYTNSTLKAAYDDLIDNRLALEARYRGPGVEDITTQASKQLTGLRARNPSGKDVVAKTELEAIADLAGGILHESQGRLQFSPVFGAKAIVARFSAREIMVGSAAPGIERRIPEYFVGYRWDAVKSEFKDEVHAFHGASIEAIGTDTLGPPRWHDEERAKWIQDDALAQRIATRMVEAFGAGEILIPFTTTYRYPELQITDLVALEVTHLVMRDVTLARELRGRLWVLGIIQRANYWGTAFTAWVRSPTDILASTEAARRIVVETIVDAGHTFRGGTLLLNWTGSAGVASVKWATSTAGFPAAGTGTVVNGQTASLDTALSFVYGDTVYVTLTPYPGAGGTGTPGTPYQFTARLPTNQNVWEYTTGVIVNVSRQAQLDGQNRTLLQALTYEIPNAEFDVWESASQPHAWTVNVTGGSAAAKETVAANIFSGDFAAKYTFAGGLAGDYQGFTTNDPIVGAFCCPLRPGASYRIKFAAKASGGAAPKVRLRFTHDAGAALLNDITATLTMSYQLFEGTFTVPPTAERRSKLAIEFTRGDTTTRNFWIDSLRIAEEVPSLSELSQQLAQVGINLVQNGDFEQDTAYWAGDTMVAQTASPIEDTKSLEIAASLIRTYTVTQVDRATKVANSTLGNPLYIAVGPLDEIYGQITFHRDVADGGSQVVLRVKEYNAAKGLVATSTAILDTTNTGLGPFTDYGGVLLGVTTRYIVTEIAYVKTAVGARFVQFDAVKLYRQPARRRVLATMSGAQSVANSTQTALNFAGTEAYDVGNLHDTVTNNPRITVLAEMVGRGGIQLVGSAFFAANATGIRGLYIRKNGSTLLSQQSLQAVSAAGTGTSLPTLSARDERPATNDYYELVAEQNSGGNLNVGAAGRQNAQFGAIHDF